MLTDKLDNCLKLFYPSAEIEMELYRFNIRIIRAVYELLNENHLNINSKGYIFIKDAICIIIDKGSMDICLEKDVYRPISEKYGIKSEYRVEQCIRYTLATAYKASMKEAPAGELLIQSFGRRPTNKKFILMAVQEVSGRVIKEL